MKILWDLIKGILKILFVLFGFTVVISGVFLTMIYFSPPEQYTKIIEKGFVQATGQKIKVKGGVEFRPRKTLNTTFNDSTLTIQTKAGTVMASAGRLYMELPWSAFFKRDIALDDVEAQDINILVSKNNKIERQFNLQALTIDIMKDCCELKISDIKLVTKEGKATGAILIDLDEHVLVVTGTLFSKKWTLDKDLDALTKTYTFQGVNDIEGKIKFHIDTLVTPKQQLKNVDAEFDLKAKVLKVISYDK